MQPESRDSPDSPDSRDSGVAAALQPFARRAMGVTFAKHLMLTLPIALIVFQVGQAVWLTGITGPAAITALVTTAIMISGVVAARQRPALIDVARRVDNRARLQDLIVSAIDSTGSIGATDARVEGLTALVRRDAIAALTRHAPRDVYPVVLPTRWRQLAAVVLVVETAALAIVWQAPARRAAESPLSSLVLPSGDSGAPSSLPQRNPAAARPTPESSGSSSAAAATAPVRSGTPGVANPAGSAPSAVSTSSNERIRLATANAAADVTAGRVPAGRRALVERYFGRLQSLQSLQSFQSERKTPR